MLWPPPSTPAPPSTMHLSSLTSFLFNPNQRAWLQPSYISKHFWNKQNKGKYKHFSFPKKKHTTTLSVVTEGSNFWLERLWHSIRLETHADSFGLSPYTQRRGLILMLVPDEQNCFSAPWAATLVFLPWRLRVLFSGDPFPQQEAVTVTLHGVEEAFHWRQTEVRGLRTNLICREAKTFYNFPVYTPAFYSRDLLSIPLPKTLASMLKRFI